ncbi:MAG: type IX secretion system sortase PorU [Saprospiraceae bacterium]|nr:type IX secretion system sortase PorU [Saprospiraceae bacterium]
MKNQSLLFIFLLSSFALNAQNSFTLQQSLQWANAPTIYILADGSPYEVWRFEGCSFGDDARSLPIFSERFVLPGKSTIEVEIVSVQWESYAKKPSSDDAFLTNNLEIKTLVEHERSQFFGRVKFIPVRKAGNGFERATSFTLNVRVTPLLIPPTPASDRDGFTYTSALSSGNIYKFGVNQTSIYKLDYAFLKNELGISDLDNIDPRSIRLFGNGGAMLPEKNSDARPDDLIENAIQVVGEQDGKFDAGDYILFYAVGPRPWIHRPHATDPEITVRLNLYDLHAWYFIKTGDGFGLRISEKSSLPASYVTDEFDDYQRIEEEKNNLLHFNSSSQGSGKRWFGDYFYQAREQEYDFNFPNLVQGSTARVRSEFAGRSSVSQSVRLELAGSTFSKTISGVAVSNNDVAFASNAILTGVIQPSTDAFKAKVIYPAVGPQSEGWLDYIEINARRRLTMAGSIMEFRDLKTLTQDFATFRLSGANGNTTVWDVTTPQTPFLQQKTQNAGVVEFGAATLGTLRNYIAFTDGASFSKPERVAGKIGNQNLHGLENLDLAIIYHPDFQVDAQRLAEHRRSYSGLDVAAVDINQLYNEFSSGKKDPTAIRDLSRMLLERNPDKFKFLLLFGDASFDPKNNTNSEDNKDFIPAFETAESFSPIDAFPSDDFYALLSPDESGSLTGALDIAVGRFVCKSPEEARATVDKIIAYDKDPITLGDWHLRTVYIADDEDGNQHLNQADKLATENMAAESWFNINKVYFDAYQQVATSAGQRYPDAKAAINSEMFKGMLVVNYIGHGGPRGLSQERVVDNNDIAGWDNPNRYPLLITATCTFGGYDDYTTLTGGEQAFLKINSGAIALFTTVRSVYIAGNEDLTDAVQDFIFQRINGKYRTIGDVLKDSKNALTSDVKNARRFTLLGDPAMHLAMPELRVATTRINGQAVTAGLPDTLRALMPVELEGVVTDTLGNTLTNFDGRVFVTIFDKAQTLQTLGQDPGSPIRSFSVQRNILFKGSSKVVNGTFKVNFVVPKDINYTFGKGKISYYAENGTPIDAAGGDQNIIIGGNSGLVQDETPPVVQAFLNTDAFAFGGITDNNPKVMVKCSDDYGMNVTGSSIGHDLTAVLDGNVLETLVLNEFYESAEGDARKGQAIYPLRNLTTGRHTLQVKGWDIANNPGEGYTEFVVAEDGKAALAHVLNYPNPFTTNTYFQFEHNLAGQILDVQVSIFSVSGRLVKTIQQTITNNDSFRISSDVQWDGNDEYGDPLARGVYLYRVKVRGTDVNGANSTAQSDFEKLVILK